MKTKNILIRPISSKDKGNYLRLFNSEDFGCIGINSDLKPSIYEEERILNGVIDKTILSTAIIVIEDNDEFIGYASISRPAEHSYHIGQFVVRSDKQGQGYGKRLMDEVKRYAAADDCDISLECISRASSFFLKQGFSKQSLSRYFYPRKKVFFQRKESLFVDYSLIEKAREEANKKEAESFQKFLESSLFKRLMNL